MAAEVMYTVVLYADKTYEIIKGCICDKSPFPDACRFFNVSGKTEIQTLELWASMGFPGGDLIEY